MPHARFKSTCFRNSSVVYVYIVFKFCILYTIYYMQYIVWDSVKKLTWMPFWARHQAHFLRKKNPKHQRYFSPTYCIFHTLHAIKFALIFEHLCYKVAFFTNIFRQHTSSTLDQPIFHHNGYGITTVLQNFNCTIILTPF